MFLTPEHGERYKRVHTICVQRDLLWPAEYKARKGLLGRNMLIGQPLGSKASNIFCLEQLFCSRNRTGHPDDMAPAMAERQPGSAEPRHPYHFTSSQLLGTLRAVAALLDVRGPFPISAARSKLHFLGFTPSLFFFFFFSGWLSRSPGSSSVAPEMKHLCFFQYL